MDNLTFIILVLFFIALLLIVFQKNEKFTASAGGVFQQLASTSTNPSFESTDQLYRGLEVAPQGIPKVGYIYYQ